MNLSFKPEKLIPYLKILTLSGAFFTIRELIWPVNLYSKRNRVRIIEFWSQNEKHFIYSGAHEWFRGNSNDLRNVTLKVLVLEHPPGVIKLTDAEGKVSLRNRINAVLER